MLEIKRTHGKFPLALGVLFLLFTHKWWRWEKMCGSKKSHLALETSMKPHRKCFAYRSPQKPKLSGEKSTPSQTNLQFYFLAGEFGNDDTENVGAAHSPIDQTYFTKSPPEQLFMTFSDHIKLNDFQFFCHWDFVLRWHEKKCSIWPQNYSTSI